MNKFISFFCLLSISMILLQCKKLEKLTTFNLDYNEQIVIPSSSGINLPFNIFTPNIESNSEAEFKINDTRKDLVKEIVLKKLVLTITSPQNGDFGFLKSIGIYLSAEGLNEIKIAWKDNVNTNNKMLELEVTNQDLKEYIKKDTFTLRLHTVTREFLTSDYHLNLYSQFFVNAKLI